MIYWKEGDGIKHRQVMIVPLVLLLVFTSSAISAPKKPTTVSELALYQGADRQQILEEGARKEGRLTLYISDIEKPAIRQSFEKKYPFIKLYVWRGGTSQMVPRLREEYQAGKAISNVVEGSQNIQLFMKESKVAQPFYSPNIVNMDKDAMIEAPEGSYYSVGINGHGISLGYNTKMINRKDLPKTYEDLLDPKWKGKMPIAGTTTGGNWVSAMLHAYSEDFVKKIAKQDFVVHMVSGEAVLDMIAAGEYALSPTIFDSHALKGKNHGATVDWIPLEPVPTQIGAVAIPKNAPNPHAAMLFIDFEMTKEAAEIHKAAGLSTFQKDVPVLRVYKKYFGPKNLEAVKRQQDLFNTLFLKR